MAAPAQAEGSASDVLEEQDIPSISTRWYQDDIERVPVLQHSGVSGGRCHRNLRDLYLLCFCFLLVFLAYGATQNLESSLNADQGLGSTSLGVLYLSFTVAALLAPWLVLSMGSKNALLLGLSGYWLFMISNFWPTWYTMIPASVYLGFTASLLWVAEGSYITVAAKNYALVCNLPEDSVIGNFNGRFWAFFAFHQVIGNFLALAIMHQGKGTGTESQTVSSTAVPLFIVFLGCMAIGTVLACFLSPHAHSHKHGHGKEHATLLTKVGGHSVRDTFILFRDVKMLLFIPLLICSGLQQAFIWGTFTESIITPALGISFVGGVMAVFGAVDAAFSLMAGRLSKGLVSMSSIILAGVFAQIFVLVCLFLKQGYGNGFADTLSLFCLAAIWGIGDGAFNTEISALLALLYPNHTESAFAQWKLWQSFATSVAFFATPFTVLTTRLIVLLTVLCASSLSFLFVVHLSKQEIISKE
eukprot:c23767_g1_i1 orf=290-1702(-)